MTIRGTRSWRGRQTHPGLPLRRGAPARLLIALASAAIVVSASAGAGAVHPVTSRLEPLRLSPAGSGSRAGAGGAAHVDLRDRAYVPGQILVRFRDGQGGASVARVNAQLGGTTLQTFTIVSNLRLIGLPRGTSVPQGVAAYAHRPEVLYAEPNSVWHVDETIPNDPNFNLQWNWKNTGEGGGKIDADVDATDAWDLTKGSSSVAVAIIDTGVQYDHVDLAANMWHNQAECNGTPGVDDEGDGYIDDCYGIDTINHDSDPRDDFNHGTHLAGIIGAMTDNGVGVSGLNWHVTMLPCKSHDNTGNGTNISLLECLQYVKYWKNHGLNIVATNNSYGGCREACGFSNSLHDAIRSQMDAGILFVASAGNDAANNDTTAKYPADYFLPNVIAVAATTSTESMAFFSNYGPRTVSLGAPGDTIYSTLFTDTYGYESGTSMSSPHVTGLAALLASYNGSWDWRALRNLILAGGDQTLAMNGKTVTGRRMNANGSLTCANKPIFGVLRPLETVHVGRQYIAALNINCAAPAGSLDVTISPGGTTATLKDDGRSPDIAAGDGVYTTRWNACTPGNYTLNFSNGQSATVDVTGPGGGC
jgi:thermitase